MFESLEKITDGDYRKVDFAHQLPGAVAEIAQVMTQHPPWIITDDELVLRVTRDNGQLILRTELPLHPDCLKPDDERRHTVPTCTPAWWQRLLATSTFTVADPLTMAFAERGITLTDRESSAQTDLFDSKTTFQDTYSYSIRKDGDNRPVVHRPDILQTFLDGNTEWAFFGTLGVLLVYLVGPCTTIH